MLWVYFTILSVLAWTFVNLLDKYTLARYVRDPIVSTVFVGSLGVVAAILISIFADMYIPSTEILLLLLSAGISYIFGVLFYFKAVITEEISRVVPLFAITPIFVLILATIFLDERFTIEKYIGIFMIVVGSLLISLRKGMKFKLSRALGLMIVSTLFWAVHTTILKYILNYLTYWNAFFWIRIGAFFVVPFLFFHDSKRTISIVTKKPRGVLYLVIAEILNVTALIFHTIALSFGFASLVSALGQIQNFLVFLFSIFLSIFKPRIIKEELKGTTILEKILAISLISFGVILVV